MTTVCVLKPSAEKVEEGSALNEFDLIKTKKQIRHNYEGDVVVLNPSQSDVDEMNASIRKIEAFWKNNPTDQR